MNTIYFLILVSGFQEQIFKDVSKNAAMTRLNIKSGHIIIEEEFSKNEKGFEKKYLKEYWFAGNKNRLDSKDFFNGEWSSKRLFQCVNCPQDGQVINGWDEKGLVVKIGKIEEQAWYVQKGINPIINGDPICLGYNLNGLNLLRKTDFGILLNPEPLKNKKINQIEFKNSKCFSLEWDEDSGRHYSYVVSPSHGWNILQIKSNALIKGEKYEVQVDSNFPSEATNGIWFPNKIEILVSLNGKIQDLTRLTVTADKLNQPIDPKIFTAEGMGFSENTVVLNSRNGKYFSVHDGKLEPYDIVASNRTKKSSTNFVDNSEHSIFRKIITYSFAFILGIIGVLFIFLKFRKL